MSLYQLYHFYLFFLYALIAIIAQMNWQALLSSTGCYAIKTLAFTEVFGEDFNKTVWYEMH